jgi:hypothetical protein
MKTARLCLLGFLAAAVPALSAEPGKNSFSRWKNLPQDEKFFPIGVWTQNPADAGKYKALGINFYYGLWNGPTAGQIQELKRHGMGVVCHFNEYAKEKLLDEPAVWGWMHSDEPDLALAFPRKILKGPGGKELIKKHWPEVYNELDLDRNEYNGWGLGLHPVNDIQAGYQAIKKDDPNRPVFLQLSAAVAQDGIEKGRGDRSGKTWEYPLYMEGSDVVSFDIYPVAYGNPDKLWQISKGIDQLKAWGSGDRPRMAVLEAGFGEVWASKHQQRAQLWLAINHGAEGITWFVHRWTKENNQQKFYSDKMPLKHPEIGQAVKELNQEVLNLASVINADKPEGAAEAKGAELDLGARRKDGVLYIFAVERAGKAGQAEITLKGIEQAEIEVLGENRTLSCRNGTFTEDFEPWAVHLYKIKE